MFDKTRAAASAGFADVRESISRLVAVAVAALVAALVALMVAVLR